jgi:hypothetical protein
MHVALLYPSKATPQAVAPPQPKTITLEPLGYVQKADGRVEAIISLAEHVEVVHEGEIFEDKFRVAKISSSRVELVEDSAPAAPARVTAEVGQGVAQDAARKAGQMNSLPFPEQASDTGAACQFDATSPAGTPKPSERQELGYVERADGRVEAIIADGEHVRLSQASKSFAKEFHGPAGSPGNVEVANSSLPATNRTDSPGLESQLVQTSPPDQEPVGQTSVASGIGTSSLHVPQGIPEDNGRLESEPLGIIQPEPLADYSGSRLEPLDVAPVPHEEPAGVVTSRGATPPLLSDGRGTQSAVNTLGYVEKAGGEKEAIVEVFGELYLVHEGELFAGKYRALKVSPYSVQIVEVPSRGASLPAGIKPDSKADAPPISRLRGPPASTGYSTANPSVEVRKAEELVAGELVVSPSRPPPEHPVGFWQRSNGVRTPRTALESVRPAQPLVQTDTRSPPWPLETVGFGEKASRETGAVVAEEGDVYPLVGRFLTFRNPSLVSHRASSPKCEVDGNCAFFLGNVICPGKECQTPHLSAGRFRVQFQTHTLSSSGYI